MKLAPTFSLPSPNVNARSANHGPNVVAVRTCSPVAGSSLIRNPPDAAPKGAVATLSAVARPRASPPCVAPRGRTRPVSASVSVNVSVVVVVPWIGGGDCAETDAPQTSASKAAQRIGAHLNVIGLHRQLSRKDVVDVGTWDRYVYVNPRGRTWLGEVIASFYLSSQGVIRTQSTTALFSRARPVHRHCVLDVLHFSSLGFGANVAVSMIQTLLSRGRDERHRRDHVFRMGFSFTAYGRTRVSGRLESSPCQPTHPNRQTPDRRTCISPTCTWTC